MMNRFPLRLLHPLLTRPLITRAVLTPSLIALAGAATAAPPPPIDIPATPAIAQERDPTASLDQPVRATVVPATSAAPPAPTVAPPKPPTRGDISLNFPDADLRAVAQAVLGDILRKNYTIAQGVTGTVTLVTPYPVSRGALLEMFETALRRSNFALVPVAAGFEIQQASAARAMIASEAIGSGSEVIRLKFVNANEVRKLLDPVLPGVVVATDPATGTLTIAGTTGQRAAARDLLEQFDVDWLRNTSFALYIPERTDARLIVPSLDKLINAPDSPTHGMVRLIAMEQLNGILAISLQSQYLDDVRRWVEILDREGENNEKRIFVYRVQNGRARDLTKTIESAYGLGGGGFAPSASPAAGSDDAAGPGSSGTTPGGMAGARSTTPVRTTSSPRESVGAPQVRVTADEGNNAIIVFGTAREYAVIEDALRKLDVPPRQILIEAAITEVSLTNDLSYGVQWNYDDRNGSTLGYANTADGVPQLQTFPGLSYFYQGSSISAAINALQKRTNVKVVSAPKLMVLNNQTASLQIGDEVPTSTGTTTNLSNTNAVTSTIEYKDTGVILKITPRVNASGVVQLDVSQEVSEVSNATVVSSTQEQSPTISTRRISTTVAVRDGQVIALGGLFSDSRSLGRNGIPGLSSLPVIGGVFGSRSSSNRRTELIVLIKPHVVSTDADSRAMTSELARKLHQLAPFRSPGQIP